MEFLKTLLKSMRSLSRSLKSLVAIAGLMDTAQEQKTVIKTSSRVAGISMDVLSAAKVNDTEHF